MSWIFHLKHFMIFCYCEWNIFLFQFFFLFSSRVAITALYFQPIYTPAPSADWWWWWGIQNWSDKEMKPGSLWEEYWQLVLQDPRNLVIQPFSASLSLKDTATPYKVSLLLLAYYFFFKCFTYFISEAIWLGAFCVGSFEVWIQFL